LTETNQFVIVFQFYNTTGCHLQKKKCCLRCWIGREFLCWWIGGNV